MEFRRGDNVGPLHPEPATESESILSAFNVSRRGKGPDPRVWSHANARLRFLVLGLGSFMMIGSYYTLDMISPLQVQLESKLKIDALQYNALFTMYNAPNFILPFFGGIIVDRLGIRTASLVFAIICLAGPLIMMLGAYDLNYNWILVGRFVFGLGGEAISVCQGALITKWFGGWELALALSVSLELPRLGSVLAYNLQPYLYVAFDQSLGDCFAVACGVSGASLLCAIIIANIDWRTDNAHSTSAYEIEEYSGFEVLAGLSWRDEIREARKLPRLIWLLALSAMFSYASVLCFNNIANEFLQDRYNMSHKRAGFVQSLPFLVPTLSIWAFGYIIDRFGGKVQMIAISSVVFMSVHVAFATGRPNPIAMLLILGLGYTMYAASIWPSAVSIVENHQWGIATGIVVTAIDIGAGIGPLFVGALKRHYNNYDASEVFLAALGGVAMLMAVWIKRENDRTGRPLDGQTSTVHAKKDDTLHEHAPLISER